ncbi:MAG TPA: hypothetical protein VLN47_09825 [Clostridiaceae bacterium]|nr:hypothetical protein [Clostridiaceae bacterium]
MNIFLRMLIAAVLLILTVGSGIWRSSLGKPYKPMLFNFHKVIAYITLANMAFFIISLLGIGSLELISVLMLLLGGLSVLALLVSGVMLNNDKFSCDQSTKIHSVASALAIFSIGIFLFMRVWGSIGIPV